MSDGRSWVDDTAPPLIKVVVVVAVVVLVDAGVAGLQLLQQLLWSSSSTPGSAPIRDIIHMQPTPLSHRHHQYINNAIKATNGIIIMAYIEMDDHHGDES